MKNLNSFANNWCFSTNHKDIGRIYLLLFIIIISISVLSTVIITVIIIDQTCPDFLLIKKVKEFYSYKMLPSMFFYVLIPLALNVINIAFITYFSKWYLLFLFGEILLILLLKYRIITSDFISYNETIVYVASIISIFIGLALYFFHERAKVKTEKVRDEAQTIVYKQFLPHHRFFNAINFASNTISVYLGSHELPVKIGFRFLLLCLVSWSLAVFMIFNDMFRVEMFLGMGLISIAFRYESLHANYHNNKAFRKNYDVNARYWIYRFSKSNSIIKRYYCTQVIKVAVNKIGTFTLVNPSRRTLIAIGGGFVFCGVLGAGVYAYKINTHGRIELEKIASKERLHKDALLSKERMHKEDLDYKLKVKQLENAGKAGWKWPWKK